LQNEAIEEKSLEPERHIFNVATVKPFDEKNEKYAKVLIVDDNAFCLIAVVSLLSQYQIECD